MSENPTRTQPRAPLSSYVLMVLLGLAASAASAAAVAFTRDDHRLLAAGVMLAATLPVTLSLGWVLFVSQHTTDPDPYAEDNVETRWFERAASRTLTDVFAAAGLATGVLAIGGDRLQPQAWLVSLAVAILILVDFGVRYTVLQRRTVGDADA
ncbi:hypothetical protein [Pseudactinotalea sp.]|uniref:hypothetical protein n=1 Tax=Pseudactinotalea sp. TaxID=1926260 RepID=UPI003B3A3DA3